MLWGQGEDVKWSKEILNHKGIKYVVNSKSIVNLIKEGKQNIFAEVNEKHVEFLNNFGKENK